MVFWACHKPIVSALSSNNLLVPYSTGKSHSGRLGAGLFEVQHYSIDRVQELAYLTGYFYIQRDAWVGLTNVPADHRLL
jgi:hypothetical protein